MYNPVREVFKKVLDYFEKRDIKRTAREVLKYLDTKGINNIEDLRRFAFQEQIPGKPYGYEQLTTPNLNINLDFGTYELTKRGKAIAGGITAHIKDIKEDLSDLAQAA